MEIRARYILIGLFTLAVIVAGFVFVYWLENKAGLGKRTVYEVRFQSTVSGLLVGSGVLFNGIRVGEVTGLKLVPEEPRQVDATIAVDASTPVRADTQASLDFQGLTGVPVVTLTGGSSSAPLLSGSSGRPPILLADPAAGQTMSGAARQVLGRIDKILEENSDPLRNMLANLNSFSEALGRNSGRVDTILAGLERMTGGAAKAAAGAYDLTALQAAPAGAKPLEKQLAVADPSSLAQYDTDKLLKRAEGGEISEFAGAKWTDALPKLLQTRIVQSFENGGYLGQVNRPIEGVTPDYQLLLDIRRFQLAAAPEPAADIELSAKVLAGDGRVVAARVFDAKEPAKSADAPDAAKALDAAFGKIAADLIVWTANAVAGGAENQPPSSQSGRRPKRAENEE